MTVCDFLKTDPLGEVVSLDKVLLSALFPDDEEVKLARRKSQLSLSLKWDRVDFARDIIFNINNADYRDVSENTI